MRGTTERLADIELAMKSHNAFRPKKAWSPSPCNAPWIARGTEEQVFEPFQRLGGYDDNSCVGLGLSVARGVVGAMGGAVHATDTPGGGLTVGIDLAAPDRWGHP
jgi:hypothetical protein